MYEWENGLLVTRKEAETVAIEAPPNMAGFRDYWLRQRREVLRASGRGEAAAEWWREIEDIKNVSFDDLAKCGKSMVPLELKLHAGAVKVLTGPLKRKVVRLEEELYNQKKRLMYGRQTMRVIYMNYRTDKTKRQMYNITHLHNLEYPGDISWRSSLTIG